MYSVISILSSFVFFSVHAILIILLMRHISAASSLFSKTFVSVQHSHPCKRMDNNFVGFQSLDFGVNSDISVGEDGVNIGECILRKIYSFPRNKKG